MTPALPASPPSAPPHRSPPLSKASRISEIWGWAPDTRKTGENARSWEALGEARPGQSTLSAGALRYRAWAHS